MHRNFIFICLLLFPFLSMGDTTSPVFSQADGVCWSLEQRGLKYGNDALTLKEQLVLLECIQKKLGALEESYYTQSPQGPNFGEGQQLSYGAQQRKWTIRIFDKLGSVKVNEAVSIKLGDERKSIIINQAIPQAYAQFDCPNGSWPYSVETFTSVAKEGNSYSVRGRTKGVIDCNGNVDFELIGDYSLYGVLLTLQNIAPVPQLNTHQPSAGVQFNSNKPIDNNSACRQVPNPRFGFGNGSAIRIESGGYSISTSTEPRYILKCPAK